MKSSARLLLIAASVLATSSVLVADDTTCPASKAKATSTTSTQCSTAKGQYVLLKLKGGDTAKVSDVFAKLDGVTKADTCCETKFTRVEYSKDKVCTDKIMAALKDAGYTIETQRVTYALEGLVCGACGDKVSRALSKVAGVADSKVCHESKQAVVDFDPNKVSADKVLAAIDDTGFKATESVN